MPGVTVGVFGLPSAMLSAASKERGLGVCCGEAAAVSSTRTHESGAQHTTAVPEHFLEPRRLLALLDVLRVLEVPPPLDLRSVRREQVSAACAPARSAS